jgi:hypothetical protein
MDKTAATAFDSVFHPKQVLTGDGSALCSVTNRASTAGMGTSLPAF